MKTNKAGIELIMRHEGFSADTYQDAAGFDTIGYGHLIKDGESFGRISREMGQELLEQDVRTAEIALERFVEVSLSTNQHAALVSWVYNLGAGAFRDSTLRRCLNAGEFHRCPGEMMRWVLAANRPLKGLIRRRADEAILFIS